MAPAPSCPSQVPATQVAQLLTFGPVLPQVGDADNRVINSDSAYRALCAGVHYTPPVLNLTTHTRLIGKGRLKTSAQRPAQHVTKTCAGRCTYAVQATRGVGQAYRDALCHAVVAKLPPHAAVDFQVQVLP
ncbi:MAG: hypothetical protein ACRYFK_19495 [Janthinobacterium lividum]